jgi:hypothetical protein
MALPLILDAEDWRKEALAMKTAPILRTASTCWTLPAKSKSI